MNDDSSQALASGTDEALRRWRWPLVLLGVAYVVLQLWSGFTEAVNWDETALVGRVLEFVQSGELRSGGRPGLTDLVLAPIFEGCRDTVSALRQGRVLWTGVTVALLAGLYQVTRRTIGSLSSPKTDALLAVLLLACIPIFLRWSVHVRTDQPAIAFALWGGVALLASRQRLRWAFLAGFLVATGTLFTQKAFYIAALVGLLAVIDLWVTPDRSERRWRAAVLRVLMGAAGAALVLGAYRFLLPAFVKLPETVSLRGGLNVFAYYRATVGFGTYIGMLPTLVPFWIIGVFAIRAFFMGAGTPQARRALGGAGAVLVLGIAVGLFHAGAFPYFWMTLGVFPAVAAALAADAVRASMPDLRSLRAATLLIVGILLVQGFWGAVARLKDNQAIQRDTLAFIDRNFPPDARGHQLRGELSCRDDPNPFPTIFMQHVFWNFQGETKDENIESVMDEFRARPVTFLLDTPWLTRFPKTLVTFWRERFVPYSEAVWVHGRALEGGPGEPVEFEVLYPGPFRWIVADEAAAGATLVVDGTLVLNPGEEHRLEPGLHRLEVRGTTKRSRFVLSLPEPPTERNQSFF